MQSSVKRLVRSTGALAAIASFLAVGAPACAYTAFVSNEKGDSITVLDTEKLEVVSTIKVG